MLQNICHVMWYDICSEQNRTCYITCVMLCYVMLYNICHVVLYEICLEQNRTCYITCVMLCYITYVMLYNMCHVMLYNICHVMLYTIMSCYVIWHMFRTEQKRTCYITFVMFCYITCVIVNNYSTRVRWIWDDR